MTFGKETEKFMSTGKKILLWIVLVFSAVFLVASLVGITTIWINNSRLTNNLLTDIKTTREDLRLANTTIDTVNDELATLATQVQVFQAVVESMGPGLISSSQAVSDVVTGVSEKLSPLLGNTQKSVNTIYDTFTSIKETIEKLNNLPLVDLDIPGGETLESILEKIEGLQSNIEDTQTNINLIADTTEEIVTTLTSNFNNWETFIEETSAALDDYQVKIEAYDQRLAYFENNLTGWIDWISIIFTIFLLWMALSSAGMFIVSYALLKDKNWLEKFVNE